MHTNELTCRVPTRFRSKDRHRKRNGEVGTSRQRRTFTSFKKDKYSFYMWEPNISTDIHEPLLNKINSHEESRTAESCVEKKE